jgi:two-component system, sensor histidine kinase YesM
MSVLSGTANAIQARVADCQRIANTVYTNSAAMELLAPSVNGGHPNYWLVKQALDDLGQQIADIGSEKYLLVLMIVGENGLDLRYGRATDFVDFDSVHDSAWYKASLRSDPPIVWPGPVEGISTREKRVIPMVRPIYNSRTGDRSGTLIMLFSPQLFDSAYPVSEKQAGAYQLTILGTEGQVIYSTPGRSPAEDFEGNSRTFTIDGHSFQQSRIVMSSSWRLIETAPMDFVEEQRAALQVSSLAVIIGAGIAGLLLASYVARRITRPLDRLLNNVDQISHGRFDSEIRIRGEDEIGRLGSGIQRMQGEIKNLLDLAIQREQNLKRAEIAALQAQINPHFIYNTLNTVRIMADMQNASGISHIVQALGRMLRIALSDRNDKITVEEELRFLEDYFYILRVRYKGTITLAVDVQDEKLHKCQIPKFILQPLIENAVLHGIEPRGMGGTVTIRFDADGSHLLIRVRDDGVGVEPERLTYLLDASDQSDRARDDKRISTGLGINNINRRIKMVYGDEYGLTYESELGQYTCVTISLPRED